MRRLIIRTMGLSRHVMRRERIMLAAAILAAVLAPPAARGQVHFDSMAIAKLFAQDSSAGCFVLYDTGKDSCYRFNAPRCDSGFLPASTFKIFNALVGLETGVIRDENDVRRWDGIWRPVPEWNRDHTMKSAIRYSVVWYFQAVAREIGEDRMREFLKKVGYGNGDISAGIDRFWLEGNFRISADGQVGFLKRFFRNELPFSRRCMQIVKSVLINDSTGAYVLRAKTGLTHLDPNSLIGWWIGDVEKGGDTYVFATNLTLSAVNPHAHDAAREVTLKILRSFGLLGG